MNEQLSLGGEPPAPSPPGLRVMSDFVSVADERELLDHVDNEHSDAWLPDLSRRVQHYGYKYDYKSRRITRGMALGPLPDWLREVARQVEQVGEFDRTPDQVIVNEYEPGQGIAPHVDCEPCFGPIVATLSLGSQVEMRLRRKDPSVEQTCVLPSRSLAVLSGPARYEWTHEIAKRKSDVINGIRTPRSRRVSLTFRTVNADSQNP